MTALTSPAKTRPETTSASRTIKPRHLATLIDIPSEHPPLLIDVRTPAEYNAVHIEGSRLLPLDAFCEKRLAAEIDSDVPVCVVCGTGKRALNAAKKLESGGFNEVVILEGGVTAWEAEDLPVHRSGSKAISLERQVRIAAGALVVIGTALGYFVHPGFFGIPAFVGAGLMFAGITDTCGMAMMLAKMPWNR